MNGKSNTWSIQEERIAGNNYFRVAANEFLSVIDELPAEIHDQFTFSLIFFDHLGIIKIFISIFLGEINIHFHRRQIDQLEAEPASVLPAALLFFSIHPGHGHQ